MWEDINVWEEVLEGDPNSPETWRRPLPIWVCRACGHRKRGHHGNCAIGRLLADAEALLAVVRVTQSIKYMIDPERLGDYSERIDAALAALPTHLREQDKEQG